MNETEVRKLAHSHLNKAGLIGWKVVFGNAASKGGSCKYSTKTLRFSRLYIGNLTDAGVRNLITHEVAHAIAGYEADHGPIWAKIHRSLGGDGRLSVAESQIIDMKLIEARRRNYIICLNCKVVVGQSVRPIKVKGKVHRQCRGEVFNVHANQVKRYIPTA
jgi:hypothetical protein